MKKTNQQTNKQNKQNKNNKKKTKESLPKHNPLPKNTTKTPQKHTHSKQNYFGYPV
jgi:hypothetical protein